MFDHGLNRSPASQRGQPMPSPTPAPAPDAEISAIISDHLSLEGPLLPILQALQDRFGMIPDAALSPICAALNIGRAELDGVISFYHDFRRMPAGRHVLRICRAEACQAMGGAALAEATLAGLGLDWHGTTADGAVTVEPVYCLGMCACAPAAMVDDRVIGRLDPARIKAVLAEVRA